MMKAKTQKFDNIELTVISRIELQTRNNLSLMGTTRRGRVSHQCLHDHHG